MKTLRCEAAVVGAGPVGLALTIDLLRRGINTVLLEESSELSEGSRAICFAKRTLEIFSRLGAGEEMLQKGVRWNKGKVFHRDQLLYEFDLAAEKIRRHPAFVNLQQYYCEGSLRQRLAEAAPEALLSGWRAVRAESQDGSAVVYADTKDGEVRVLCDYVAACDGAKSTLRAASGIQTTGEQFRDRFLISDIKMRSDFPSERWFWFDPPFHPGRSALLHKQPDNVWRIDLQLGWHADPREESKPENVLPRLRAMLGDKAKFDLEWVSVYAFQSQRMERFSDGRVFFAGDAAHQVSPFGARGANSGVQDADNLAWKIAHTLRHGAADALLSSYHTERAAAADENILHSSRSTHFIAPPTDTAQAFRDAALALAKKHPFARGYVNSGRLSTAAVYDDSPLNAADEFSDPAARAGAAMPDAPLAKANGKTAWLSEELSDDFNCLVFSNDFQTDALEKARAPVQFHQIASAGGNAPLAGLTDNEGLARQRFGIEDSDAVVLLRPDGHVCGRWRAENAAQVTKTAEVALKTVETILQKGAVQ